MDNYPRRYRRACQALEALLTRLLKVEPPWKVSLYAHLDKGFRLDEISISTATAGSVWMRCNLDVHSMAMFLACEDFILTYDIKPVRPEGWTSDLDLHLDAQEKLEYLVGEIDKLDSKARAEEEKEPA